MLVVNIHITRIKLQTNIKQRRHCTHSIHGIINLDSWQYASVWNRTLDDRKKPNPAGFVYALVVVCSNVNTVPELECTVLSPQYLPLIFADFYDTFKIKHSFIPTNTIKINCKKIIAEALYACRNFPRVFYVI